MNRDDVTFLVALWGAVVATGSVAWSILRDARDRGRLRIDLLIGTSSNPQQGIVESFGEVEITNVGRRELRPMVVTVEHTDRRQFRPIYYKTPHTDPLVLVPEERWLVASIRGDEVLRIRDIVVVDTSGRRHRLGYFGARRFRRFAADRLQNHLAIQARARAGGKS